MRPLLAVVLVAVLLGGHPICAADDAGAGDAAALFVRAADATKPVGPSNSNFEVPDHPPYGETWTRLARESWEANGPARDVARQARTRRATRWPAGDDKVLIQKLRALSCELADDALYAQTQGDHAGAVELARDGLHLAEVLESAAGKSVIHALVASGVTAQAMQRLMVITSDVALTRDGKDPKALDVAAGRELIAHLLDQRDPSAELVEILGPKGSPAWSDPKISVDRIIETLNRANAERTFAAMSLACHLFRFDTGRWPRELAELSPKYVPRVPVDPWGDGKQTFGYALIKAGQPDGGDRPLVYSRCESSDGLQYRTDDPQYGFYNPPRIRTETGPRIVQAGQFRDVARWSKPQGAGGYAPELKPLE
jgi:hypothetical protein